MSKYTAYYHIVFCTKFRKFTIPLELRADLYRVIWKIITDNNSKLLRIGGIQNHVHILLNLHPTVPLSVIVQRIKSISSSWMRKDTRFLYFEGWAKEYYACTVSPDAKDSVIEYIKTQEQHHLNTSEDDEFIKLFRYAGVTYDPKDMI